MHTRGEGGCSCARFCRHSPPHAFEARVGMLSGPCISVFSCILACISTCIRGSERILGPANFVQGRVRVLFHTRRVHSVPVACTRTQQLLSLRGMGADDRVHRGRSEARGWSSRFAWHGPLYQQQEGLLTVWRRCTSNVHTAFTPFAPLSFCYCPTSLICIRVFYLLEDPGRQSREQSAASIGSGQKRKSRTVLAVFKVGGIQSGLAGSTFVVRPDVFCSSPEGVECVQGLRWQARG